MTGFFKGPSLLTHVLIVATVSAIAVPLARDRTGSWTVTAAAWVAFLLLYGAGALFHSSR